MSFSMKKYIFLLLFIAFGKCVLAASPAWTVNSSSYQYSMTVTGPIIINGVESDGPNALVGAFVGDECRGVSQLYYTESVDRYVSYLLVYSNTPGETISFKLYDASDDVVYDVSKTLSFEINGINGTVNSPYILSYPDIGFEAEILSFSINGEVEPAVITDTVITTTMAYGASLNNLVADFTLSTGAKARVSGELQYSGITLNDFNSDIVYEITSEDELAKQEYVVTVEFGDADPTDISLSDSTIIENEPVGTIIGYFSTVDPNPDDEHTYSLVNGIGDNDNSKFIIEGNILKTNEEFDYETQRVYSVLIQTDDGNGGTYEEAFSIYATNLNDENPVVTNTTINVSESFLLNDTVYTVEVFDADSIGDFTYEIVGGNFNNTFGINLLSGVITLEKELDFESLTFFTLTIEVADEINIGIGTVKFEVIDENDELPVVSDASVSVSETANIGDEVCQVAVTDEDANSDFVFSISSGNGEDKFQVDSESGIITLKNLLDYQVTQSYTLTVSVNDGVNTSTGEVFVKVHDENDVAPVVVSDTVSIPESTINSVIHTVSASDPDEGAELSFTIEDGNSQGNFDIDSQTGSISVIGSLDFESVTSCLLTVSVSDGLNSGEGTILVNITNTNDEKPVIADSTILVSETTAVNDTIFEMVVSDPDGDTVFEYFIAGGNHNNTFAINTLTGVITLEQEIDYETLTNYVLTLEADDEINIGSGTLLITIIDENDEAPEVNDGFINVHEDSNVGDTIHQVIVTDKDGDENFNFSITSGNNEDKFQIDPVSGVITLKNQLDYLVTQSYSLIVTVNDGVNNSTGEMTINVHDDNNLPPVVTSDTVSISESILLNSLVHTVEASDPDDAASLSYSIVDGNGLGHFDIDEPTGDITVVESLDFETVSSYLLTIRVSDDLHTTQGTILVNLININDENPVVNDSTIYVDETLAVNDTVFEMVVFDPDMDESFVHSIVGGNHNSAFAINSLTGVITLETKLDFENQTSYELTLETDDGVNIGSGMLSIEIVDKNDETPSLESASLLVPENSTIGDSIYTLSATDQDANSILEYTIVSGNDRDKFILDTYTGELQINGLLDYEAAKSYVLTVEVTDGENSTQATVDIDIVNLNDEVPVVTSDTLYLPETTSSGTAVYSVKAEDADKSELTYTIVGGNTNSDFYIINTTGEIVINNSLDFETTSSYVLELNVSDPDFTGAGTLLIIIEDENDEVPVLEDATIIVPESTSVGSIVYMITPTDGDANTTFTFSISGDYSEHFSVDESTGEIEVSNLLDYEEVNQYVLTMDVSDGVNSTTATLIINISDENEAPELVDNQFSVNENSANGTVVGQVQILDTDIGGTYSFEIISGNTGDAFTINSAGTISVNNSDELDYEDVSVYYLDVVVKDVNYSTLEDTGTVEVGLIDMNENPELEPQFFGIDENSENGTSVGYVLSYDVDYGQELTYTIIDGDQNAFAINELTGEITVSNGELIDYEESDIQKLTVQVTDNGASNLTAEAVITIEIYDVIETTLQYTNYISPNGDGHNDYWVIENAYLYADCSVMIYDGNGNIILDRKGYDNGWNGIYKGDELPSGTYFFIINCGDENMLYKGFITLIR